MTSPYIDTLDARFFFFYFFSRENHKITDSKWGKVKDAQMPLVIEHKVCSQCKAVHWWDGVRQP